MSWVISVGKVGQGRAARRGESAEINCLVTASACHTVAQLSTSPVADKRSARRTSVHGARQAEQVWQNVLSILVGLK